MVSDMPAPPVEDDLKHIGSTVRDLRLDAGHNQRVFAQKVGISTRWLGEIENGRQRASELTYRAIAKVLGITLNQLIGGPS